MTKHWRGYLIHLLCSRPFTSMINAVHEQSQCNNYPTIYNIYVWEYFENICMFYQIDETKHPLASRQCCAESTCDRARCSSHVSGFRKHSICVQSSDKCRSLSCCKVGKWEGCRRKRQSKTWCSLHSYISNLKDWKKMEDRKESKGKIPKPQTLLP